MGPAFSLMNMIHREPDVQRYLFWAVYYGGEQSTARARVVQYYIAGYAAGSYPPDGLFTEIVDA